MEGRCQRENPWPTGTLWAMILPSASLLGWLLAAAAAVAYAVPAAAGPRLGTGATRTALALAWGLHGAVLAWALVGETPPRFGFAPALSMTAWLVLTV